MRRCLIACIAPLAGAAWGQNAVFDSFSEGFPGTVVTENGLTFRDLDQRIPGAPPPNTFAIENASGYLGGMLGFSSPNGLGFGAYSPGPQAAFGRIGSVRILPPAPRSFVMLDVFELGSSSQNTISLAAFFQGQEVGRTTVPITQFGLLHWMLHLSGPTFDEVRLIGEGEDDSGCFFGIIDNVAFGEVDCYVNCDGSTVNPVLNVQDFLCFLNKFTSGDTYANCDSSTVPPVLNISDFTCFLNRFNQGCGL